MDIYGIIGWPVKHSLSPVMQEPAFKELGIKAKYIKIPIPVEPVDSLESFLLDRKAFKDTDRKSVRIGDLAGFNVTIPHKIKAREILEREYPLETNTTLVQEDLYYVKLTGAINTVRRDGDLLKYWNTDAPGFLKALEEDLEFDTDNKNVFLIGCGGAGRAIIAALSWKQMEVSKIYIYELSKDQIASTKDHFLTLPEEWQRILEKKVEFVSLEKIAERIKDSQLLVNASPVGMNEEDLSPIDKRLLNENLCVYDVIYNRKTQLIKDAKAKGAKAVTGEDMLAWQGALAFSYWIDKCMPIDVIDTMKKALYGALKR